MDEIIKEKWVAALRSGEYKQGTCQLRNGSTFCCLGVLCDLYIKGHPEVGWSLGGCDSIPNHIVEYRGNLPNEVKEWAGLEFPDPVVVCTITVQDVEGVEEEKVFAGRELSWLNDQDVPFTSIAGLIEAQL
jgi:hypothetical protein